LGGLSEPNGWVQSQRYRKPKLPWYIRKSCAKYIICTWIQSNLLIIRRCAAGEKASKEYSRRTQNGVDARGEERGVKDGAACIAIENFVLGVE
jgi:hypothetical protein